jgi:drug/metabolite transporter (DMT)-like permease
MTISTTDNRAKAAVLIILAIFFASSQDAIVKFMSASYPAYESVIFRALTSLPILLIWQLRNNSIRSFLTPHWRQVLLRALILCSAYFAFILAIAAMPIANMVAIYFTMPFFVAGLAGPLLGERVPLYRWIAIIGGFVGVLIMVRPGIQALEPASLLALYSAFGYAVGQMMGRRQAQVVPPMVIANFQNAVYLMFAVVIGGIVYFTGFSGEANKSLAFLTRPFVMPNWEDFLLLVSMGVLATFTLVCFINAYRLAEANFVAPFEYSGMIWAVLYGFLLFDDFPDLWTWSGMAVVAGAGFYMLARDRIRVQIG